MYDRHCKLNMSEALAAHRLCCYLDAAAIFLAITAVILGGTRLSGGVGRVERTLLGAIIVGMILNYMTIMGISAHYQRAVTGFIILGAALLDQLSRTRSNK